MIQIRFWLKQACKRHMSYLSHTSQSLYVYLFIHCATLSHITLVFFFFLCIFIRLFGNCRRILHAFPKPSIYFFHFFFDFQSVLRHQKENKWGEKNTLCLSALALQFNTDLTDATTEQKHFDWIWRTNDESDSFLNLFLCVCVCAHASVSLQLALTAEL